MSSVILTIQQILFDMWKILFAIWKILFETLLWGCNEDCTRLYSLLHNPLCRSNTTTSVQQEYNSLCNITTARSTVQEGATNVHIVHWTLFSDTKSCLQRSTSTTGSSTRQEAAICVYYTLRAYYIHKYSLLYTLNTLYTLYTIL